MTEFFVSDTHFGHANIIKYAARPFSNLDEMNEVLIERWNSKVTAEDRVFHLGDFAFKDKPAAKAIFQRLNGIKVLIRGNHDDQATLHLGWFAVHDYFQYHCSQSGIYVMLCHYPMLDWPAKFHGALHFYGHVHDRFPQGAQPGSYNLCVEKRGYQPVTLRQVIAEIST